MAIQKVERLKQDILEKYCRRTCKSKLMLEEARKRIPGGCTRSVAFYKPYPFFAVEGRGCKLYDCDGNEYIDYVNNYTALIHGHAHPHVIKAINAQVEKGTSHSAPIEIQYRLAEHLCDRIPAMDSIRFCNSGTEATLFAMRAARAYTGKDGFIKIDGGYHGAHDFVGVNIASDLSADNFPKPISGPGVPVSVLNDIFIVPFNDPDSVETILKKQAGKIAAIIMEPMLGAGGLIMPQAGYLEQMRKLADQYGVLLILDEIITFRFHEGGAQTMIGVMPDLTTLGKIIGGGFPVGAFGGKKEIMEIFDPENTKHVGHSGTFSGNAVTMVAGLANMEIFRQKEADQINDLGNRLRKGILETMDGLGVNGQCTGYGSLIQSFFTRNELNNARNVGVSSSNSSEMLKYLHLDMMNMGIFFVNRGMFSISTPMTEQVINRTIDVFKVSLEKVKSMAV